MMLSIRGLYQILAYVYEILGHPIIYQFSVLRGTISSRSLF